MSTIGLSKEFVRMYAEVPKDTFGHVYSGNKKSDQVETTAGVHQGCILSPVIFALFIYDLVNHLSGALFRITKRKARQRIPGQR